MKRLRAVLLAAGSALVSAACLTSLHPWFTEKDLVFEPALIGTWVDDAEADTSWTFERQDDTTYTLIDTRDENQHGLGGKPAEKKLVTVRLTARLMRVGQTRFLDICAGDKWTDSSMLTQVLVNSHVVARIRLEGDTLRIGFLDEDWLVAMLDDKTLALSHEVVDASGDADVPPTRIHSTERRTLLTAPTSELQQFLAKFASSAEAFGDEEQMRRKAPAK